MPVPSCLEGIYTPGHIPIDPGIEPAKPVASSVIAVLLDTRLLRQADDTAGASLRHYMAASADIRERPSTWYSFSVTQPGKNIWAGINAGSQYGLLASVPTFPAEPLDSAGASVLDATGTITVTPITHPSLAFPPFSALPSGGSQADKYIAIGNPNRWVLCQYTTVTQVGANYVFGGGVCWGIHGSEVYLSQLVAGDKFVFIGDPNTSVVIAASTGSGSYPVGRIVGNTWPLSYLGTVWKYAAGYNQDGSDIGTYNSVTIKGEAEIPPASINLAASESGGDIVFTWLGRSRFFPWSATESDAPDRYDVEVMNGASVVQTWTDVTAQTVTYLAADIAADFGGMPGSITFRVYKKSTVIGRGHRAEKTETFASSGIGVLAAGAAAISGSGAEPGWELFDSWTYSTDVAQVDFTGLAGYTNVLIIGRAVARSASTTTIMRVSTDNGSSFLAGSSDYALISAAGAETAGTSIALHDGTGSGRSFAVMIEGINVNGAIKPVMVPHRAIGANAGLAIGTTSPITAIRFLATSAANLTGGAIWVFAQ